jgi:simple sugar transport system ATP-binding protein
VKLELRGITKRFGTLTANDAIDLVVEPGEIHALLGENGAGKSTLMAILFGHYVADAGHIEVEGRALPPGDTRAALAAGIGMVHQHFTLADNLSVLDNVMLGTEPLWRPFSRRRAARDQLLATAQRFGLQVDPQARIADLSMGERQQVEILKALVRGARVLILDEPTAVLTPQQSEALFATLRGLVREGLSILFISHKLDEVRRVSDRVAVLRAGRLVARFDQLDGVDKATLAEAMVSHAVAPLGRGVRQSGALVARLRDVSVAGKPRPRLDRVTLELHAHEVLGIAGISGNGHVMAEQDGHERALARAVLAQQGQHLAAAQLQRDVVVGQQRAEALADVRQPQQRRLGVRGQGHEWARDCGSAAHLALGALSSTLTAKLPSRMAFSLALTLALSSAGTLASKVPSGASSEPLCFMVE